MESQPTIREHADDWFPVERVAAGIVAEARYDVVAAIETCRSALANTGVPLATESAALAIGELVHLPEVHAQLTRLTPEDVAELNQAIGELAEAVEFQADADLIARCRAAIGDLPESGPFAVEPQFSANGDGPASPGGARIAGFGSTRSSNGQPPVSFRPYWLR